MQSKLKIPHIVLCLTIHQRVSFISITDAQIDLHCDTYFIPVSLHQFYLSLLESKKSLDLTDLLTLKLYGVSLGVFLLCYLF